MKYKGVELKEADGKDYPLGPTPRKKMLVWELDDVGAPIEREVLGCYDGEWVATHSGGGVETWAHAAEIPHQKTLTELACEVWDKNKLFPYAVHPKNVQLTREEKDRCVDVREEDIMLYGHAMSCRCYTFIIHPECCDIVKAMAKRLAEQDDAHPTVIFFGE